MMTTAGTVAHYHVVDREGPDAFDANETDLVYRNKMWHAVDLFNVCPVTG